MRTETATTNPPAYFNHARPHQGIEQRIPCQPEQGDELLRSEKIISHPVLGGLHHDYRWQAQETKPLPHAA
jgi:hypothetical protein